MSRLVPPMARRAWLFTTSFAFVASATIFINDNLYEVTSVGGSSMAPTLSPLHHATGARDWVVWRKWEATRDLRRGDVVHFLNPSHPESLAVKRVVALEGDTVVLDPRRRPGAGLGRDGQQPPLVTAAVAQEDKAWRAWRGRVQVPPGHVWLEGDNWRASRDSNYYGPVSKSLITGRALWVLRPWERAGSRPWEGFEGATKVEVGTGRRGKEWTVDGLPIELLELGEESVLPTLDPAARVEVAKPDQCRSRRFSG